MITQRFQAAILLLVLSLFVACGTSEPPRPEDAPAPETVAEPSPSPTVPPPAPQAAQGALGNMPLAFEENQGQFDPQALFAARHGSGTFFFTADSLAAVFTRTTKTTDYTGDPDRPVGDTEMKTESFALKIGFVGSSGDVVVEAEEPLEGKVSYFHGNDPEAWVSRAATFKRLVYRDVWPGIDLMYSGSAGRLNAEYRLVRAADVTLIKMHYAGQDKLRLDEAGRLVIVTPWGEINEEAPRAVQNDMPVEIAYGLDAAAGVVWFELENADPDAPLVINP